MKFIDAEQIQYFDQASLTPDIIRALIEQGNRNIKRTHPLDPPQNPEEVVAQLLDLPAILTVDLWAMMIEGMMVASGFLQCVSMGSNEDRASLELLVDPQYRRQGLGTALLERAALRARGLGRSTLMTASTNLNEAGAPFLFFAGFEARQENGINQLKLSELPEGVLSRWTNCPDDDYTLEIWHGDIPEQELDAYSELFSVMNDAPTDDLKAEDFRMTPEILREQQKMKRAANQDTLTAVVRHSSGEMVGLNELVWRRATPTHVQQGGTGVKPAHWGHRLGQWLKAANIVKLLDVNPDALVIRTTNAVSNAPMLRINTEMGFRPYMTTTIWQADTSEVLARLGG